MKPSQRYPYGTYSAYYNREQRINNKYRQGKKIGDGAFGEVFEGIDISTKTKVAIKREPVTSKYPLLVREARLMKLLGLSTKSLGIPRIRWYGKSENFNYCVMELLGQSLEDKFTQVGRRLSLKSVLMICDQLLKRIEYIHSKNFIHRDLKPQNILVGLGNRKHIIHLIDFGLSKKYRDSNFVHIPYRDGKNLTGTARYASINNHLGIEQSRRDDLEVLGYILLYFLRGKLPWQNMKARTKNEKYNRICEKKTSVSLKILCEGFPVEFRTYLHYVRSLGFEDKPDYTYLRKMFKQLFVRRGYKMDYKYDWDDIKKDAIRKDPIVLPLPQIVKKEKKTDKLYHLPSIVPKRKKKRTFKNMFFKY